MRAWLAGVFVALGIAGAAWAETPGHMLTEATGIAQAIADPTERRHALEAIITAYAGRGDLIAAADVLLAESNPAVMSGLWIALVRGALDGPDAAAPLAIAGEIPDAVTRDIALRHIAWARADAADIAGVEAVVPLLSDPGAQQKVRAEIVDLLLEDGREDEAMAARAALTDPEARDMATLFVVIHLADDGRVDAALPLLAEIGAGGIGQIATVVVIRGLARDGRWDEVEAMLTAASDRVRNRAAAQIARVTAEAGVFDSAGQWLLRIVDPVEAQVGHGFVAGVLARAGDVAGAVTVLDGLPDATARDQAMGALVSSLVESGDLEPARDLASRMTGIAAEAARAAIAVAEVETDRAAAMATLANLTDAGARADVLRALVAAGDGSAAEDEALALARAIADPGERVQALAALAAAVP